MPASSLFQSMLPGRGCMVRLCAAHPLLLFLPTRLWHHLLHAARAALVPSGQVLPWPHLNLPTAAHACSLGVPSLSTSTTPQQLCVLDSFCVSLSNSVPIASMLLPAGVSSPSVSSDSCRSSLAMSSIDCFAARRAARRSFIMPQMEENEPSSPVTSSLIYQSTGADAPSFKGV